MRDIENLTPHPIYFLDDEERRVGMLPRCENPLRVEGNRIVRETFKARVYCPVCEGHAPEACDECSDGTVEVESDRGYKEYYHASEEALPVQDGTLYIVSSIVAQNSDRDDFLVPNTIRDGDGHVIGCVGFDEIG